MTSTAKKLWGTLAAICSFGATTLVTLDASAETIAYKVPAASVGGQAWGGALGMEFNVGAAPINVYSLGVFDSSSDGLKAAITAYIYNRDTQALVVKLLFPVGSGTLIDGSRFAPLPCPVQLPANFHGVIVADGYGATEPNGNSQAGGTTNSGGGAISFLPTARYAGAAGVYPNTVDGGPANRYWAGTFAFAVACTDDTGCTNAAYPKCSNGICGRATGDFHNSCTGATAACDLTQGKCVACQSVPGPSNACLGPDSLACKGTGECVKCTDNTTCGGVAPLCGAANTCNACDGDNGQATTYSCPSALNPFCKADGSCGACAGHFGSGVTNACGSADRPFCKADGSCGSCAGGFGSGVTNACDTAAKPVCTVGGSCVVANGDNGTTSTAPCPTSANPYANADGSCGKCTQNTDCVGAQHGGSICNTVTGSCGNVCAVDGDCAANNFCDLTAMPASCTPKKSGGATCSSAAQCLSNSCTATKCDTGCTTTADCVAGNYCDTVATPKICKAKKANGSACTLAEQCTGGACSANVCATVITDAGVSSDASTTSDAGMSSDDSGVSGTDSGSSATDGGTSIASDSGTGSPKDSGAGVTNPDIGGEEEGGCSCESPRTNAAVSPYVLSMFGLAVFGVWRRRKNRASR